MVWENSKIFMGWRRTTRICEHSLTHSLIYPLLKVFYAKHPEFRVRGDYTHSLICAQITAVTATVTGAPRRPRAGHLTPTLWIRDASGRSRGAKGRAEF